MMNVIDAMADPEVLGGLFDGDSWATWRAVLKAAYGLPLDDAELELFRSVAERDPPAAPVKELWCVVGRRGGKDSIGSAIATVTATMNDFIPYLRPGERATVACIAATRDQAKIMRRYVGGTIADRPLLAAMVERETDELVELTNRAEIAVLAGNFRSLRGRAFSVIVLDEIAFFMSDTSANPDVEIYNALVPGLATLPGSLLIGISSPWKRAGLLYEKWRESFGKDDPDVLVIQGASRIFNPSLPQEIVDKAMAKDPQVARAEWGAEWRDDLAGFLSRDALDALIDTGVSVRPPQARHRYVAFADVSGGQHDSSALGIAHKEGEIAVLDCLYERRAPHSPDTAIGEMAELLKQYGVRSVVGDRYAANFVVDAFGKRGIVYAHSELNRSEIYLGALPGFTSGRVRLLDDPRMISQFAALERRTFSSGLEKVDHPRAGADDASNAAAGAIHLAMSRKAQMVISDEMLARSAMPGPATSRYSRNPRAFFGSGNEK